MLAGVSHVLVGAAIYTPGHVPQGLQGHCTRQLQLEVPLKALMHAMHWHAQEMGGSGMLAAIDGGHKYYCNVWRGAIALSMDFQPNLKSIRETVKCKSVTAQQRRVRSEVGSDSLMTAQDERK